MTKRDIGLLLCAALAVSGCSTAPLNRAASRGDAASLKAQLDKGADPNMRGIVGETPLMSAAFSGSRQAVEVLLAAGADVNARWRYGTPLSYAAQRGHTDIVRLLLDRGAQCDDQAVEAAKENAFSALARELSLHKDRQSGKGAPSVDQPRYSAAPRADDLAVLVSVDQDNDAEALLRHLKALGFLEDRIASLKSRKATRTQLVAHLEEWLPARVKPESTVVFYYSGRGGADAKTGQALLLPWDVDANFLQSTAYPLRQVYERLAGLKAKKVFIVLDSAFSGAAAEDLRPADSITALMAASNAQIAGALQEQHHGLLTYYLLQGLSEGKRTTRALYDYLKPLVEEQARRQGRQQTPALMGADAEI